MISAVQWEKKAQADRETIFRYLYREAGLLVGSATDDKFTRMASLLSENPRAGKKSVQKNNINCWCHAFRSSSSMLPKQMAFASCGYFIHPGKYQAAIKDS